MLIGIHLSHVVFSVVLIEYRMYRRIISETRIAEGYQP